MNVNFVSAAELGLERVADVLGRGFSDYLVKLPVSVGFLLNAVRVDGVDLTLSRVVCRDGIPVGVAMIARRGWTSRLAAMALVPEARRQRLGHALVQHLLAEAKARGDRAMVLEVIEQNPPAVSLYEQCGFTRVRRLVGFSRAADDAPGAAAGEDAAALEEVDPRTMAGIVAAHGLADLPWQLAAETLAQLGPPVAAFRRRGAWALLSDPTTKPVVVCGLVIERGAEECLLAELLRTLLARYGDREWRVPAIWPEQFSRTFVDAGFQPTALSQWQMRLDLGQRSGSGGLGAAVA